MALPHGRLVGREEEFRALLDVATGAPGSGGTLLVRGEPGIGKSALLAEVCLAAQERDVRVLRATGVDTETHLPFSGLYQLIHPVLERARDLPSGQCGALLGAFGMVEGSNPDPFLIALAVLQLLSDVAEDGPLLLAVDDAQWLDPASRDVLAFVARRLEGDPIAVLVTDRAGQTAAPLPLGVPELVLTRLDARSSTDLLTTVAPELDTGISARVLAEAAGNPLALVELPAARTGPQDGPVSGASGPVPLTARLRRAFSARFLDLPPAARALAVVAAIDDGDSLGEMLDALAGLVDQRTDPEDVLLTVVAADLVSVSTGRLSFRHPLIRSAIHSAVPPSERRRAHGALADVLSDAPDRRALHRAASTARPDEQIAAELEAAALRARERGAAASTVTALERAAELSTDPEALNRRLLAAAEIALALGAGERAGLLTQRVDRHSLSAQQRARWQLVRESVDPGAPGDPAKVLSLVATGVQLARGAEADLALEFLQTAARLAWWADPGEEARGAVVSATELVAVPSDDARLLSVYGFTDPEGHGATIIEQAARRPPDSLDPESASLIGGALNVAGAFDASAGFLAAAVTGARERGSAGRLAEVLTQQAWTAINMANWQVAITAADEAVRLAEETSQPLWGAAARSGQAMIAALRGSAPAEALADQAEAFALPVRASAVLCGVQLTRGVTALGAGRYEEAWAHLRRLFDERDPAHHHFQSLWALGDLAEAAVHAGHVAEAIEVTAAYDDPARLERSPWIRVGLAYGRPLLAAAADADDLFEAALASDVSRWPTYQARLLLEYGSWTRRRRRRNTTARAQLHAALETCERLGLTPWADRARRELRAAGEAIPGPRPQAWARLSPQELHIAQLAATGLSNRQIGHQLFLSPRTVGSHLYRIYPKLGIASRSSLAAALRGADPGG